MKFSLDKQEKYTIMTLEEDNLNSIVAPDLKSELVLLRNNGVPNFILNLEKVKFVDSSGLSSILTANRLWKGDGSFVLAGATQPHVKKLIEISRLDSVMSIVPTSAEAVDYVFMEELERDISADSDE